MNCEVSINFFSETSPKLIPLILRFFFFLSCLLFFVGFGLSESFANDSALIRIHILSKYHPQKLKLTNNQNSGQNLLQVDIDNPGRLRVEQNRLAFWNTRDLYLKSPTIWTLRGKNSKGKDFVRSYEGHLSFQMKKKELFVINHLTIAQYLKGVLAAEFAQAPLEALKAQAILARTLAYFRVTKPKQMHPQYHLGDLTIDQAYAGYLPQKRFRQAVEETRDLVITHQKQLFYPFWHSTCGRNFYTPQQVWGGKELPYLKPQQRKEKVSPHLCRDYPHYSWSRTIEREKVQAILDKKYEGAVQKGKYPFKSGLKIKLGPQGSKILKPEHFRLTLNRVLGWNFLKSNDYTLLHLGENIRFQGNGLGHNIGMCQCEAMELAKRGYPFQEILMHYYHDIQIGPYQTQSF